MDLGVVAAENLIFFVAVLDETQGSSSCYFACLVDARLKRHGNAEGEKGKMEICIKHTLKGACVRANPPR
jgi:hypothetical protein